MNRLFALAVATLALSGSAAAGSLPDRPYMYHDENASSQAPMAFSRDTTIITSTEMRGRALLPEATVTETVPAPRVFLPRATTWNFGLAPYSSYKDEDPVSPLMIR